MQCPHYTLVPSLSMNFPILATSLHLCSVYFKFHSFSADLSLLLHWPALWRSPYLFSAVSPHRVPPLGESLPGLHLPFHPVLLLPAPKVSNGASSSPNLLHFNLPLFLSVVFPEPCLATSIWHLNILGSCLSQSPGLQTPLQTPLIAFLVQRLISPVNCSHP